MDDTTSLVKKNPAAFPVGVMAGLHGTQIGLMIRPRGSFFTWSSALSFFRSEPEMKKVPLRRLIPYNE